MQAWKSTIVVVVLVALGYLGIGLLYYDQKPGTAFAYAAGSIIAAAVLSGIVTVIVFYASQKSSRAANIALMLASVSFFLGSIDVSRKNSPVYAQGVLQKAIADANRSLPQKIDDITELRSILYDPDSAEISYVHEISGPDFAVTEEMKGLIADQAMKLYQTKFPQGLQTIVRNEKIRVYYVYHKAGRELMRARAN